MRRKNLLQQNVADRRQDLVRSIKVLDCYEASMNKGFNLLEQEIRNHSVFSGIINLLFSFKLYDFVCAKIRIIIQFQTEYVFLSE